MPTQESLQHRIMTKMAQRKRIGWVDWCSDSWDCCVAQARAWRIRMRCRGIRMTLAQAMYPERYPNLMERLQQLSAA